MSQAIEYIIITLSNYTAEELTAIDECCITNIKDCRHNNDKTKCIVKTTSPTLISNHTCYNFIEINKIILKEEWVSKRLQ